mgnify:CR=1 FL=1
MEDLTEIYNDLIMEHSTNSYNKRELEKATASEWDTIQTVETK